MKTLLLPLVAVVVAALAGCAGVHKTGTSQVDEFDAIKVDQMTGNDIAPRVLAKTVLCLNGRRESRRVTAVTNVVVTAMTNLTVTPVTNLTISVATNHQFSVMTNLAAATPAPPALVQTGDAPPAAATPPAVGAAPPGIEATSAAITNAPAALSTNTTISVANNASSVTTPNQAIANLQSVRSYNNQFTTTSNNLSIAAMTNRVVTAETNIAVTWVTNLAVVSVTNVTITPTNAVARDYYLVSELIAPPDFTPASGESLVLLVDGVRHGFASSPSGAPLISRRGYTSASYRVPPEVLVAIANAKEARIRFKGVSSVLERTMSAGSKQHFKDFLLKYFSPEPPAGAPAPSNKKMASATVTSQP